MTRKAAPAKFHWQYAVSEAGNARWPDGQFFNAIDYAIAVAIRQTAKAKMDHAVCLSMEPMGVHVLSRSGARLPKKPKLGLLRLIQHEKLVPDEVRKANRQLAEIGEEQLPDQEGPAMKEYNVICAVQGRVHVTVKARSAAHARELIAADEGVEFMPADLQRGKIIDIWPTKA